MSRKMSEEHKNKIAATQRERWQRAKAPEYTADQFDYNVPMSAILEAINARAQEGWVHAQTLIKDGVTVLYVKRKYD